MSERRPSLRLVPGGSSDSEPGVDFSGEVLAGESEHALLQAGKISVEQFMDMSVDRALSHLVGQVSTERLSLMREILRAQLEQDPSLEALVTRAASSDA